MGKIRNYPLVALIKQTLHLSKSSFSPANWTDLRRYDVSNDFLSAWTENHFVTMNWIVDVDQCIAIL